MDVCKETMHSVSTLSRVIATVVLIQIRVCRGSTDTQRGRARFLLCTGFIIISICFVGDQTQTSTWPNRDWEFESRNL